MYPAPKPLKLKEKFSFTLNDMQLILIFLAIILSIPIVCTVPLALGAWLLLCCIVLITIIAQITPWIRLILFLIYIGGLLVLFAYFSSAADNRKPSITTAFLSSILYALTLYTWPAPLHIFALLETTNKTLQLPKIILRTFLTPRNLFLLIFIVCILFLTLIVVVKCALRNQGCLRPFHH